MSQKGTLTRRQVLKGAGAIALTGAASAVPAWITPPWSLTFLKTWFTRLSRAFRRTSLYAPAILVVT